MGPMGQMAMKIFYSPRNSPVFGFGLKTLLGGTLLLVVGCGPTIPELRAKAANEMNCPVSELDLERVDSDTMAVIGCGGETIYSTYCDKTAEGKTCGWRADPKTENVE